VDREHKVALDHKVHKELKELRVILVLRAT
jgi:hypothetical protein